MCDHGSVKSGIRTAADLYTAGSVQPQIRAAADLYTTDPCSCRSVHHRSVQLQIRTPQDPYSRRLVYSVFGRITVFRITRPAFYNLHSIKNSQWLVLYIYVVILFCRHNLFIVCPALTSFQKTIRRIFIGS